MALLDAIDNYCERTGPELLSEPLNVFSNIAFFIAACALWKQYRESEEKDGAVITLIILIALVGTGSTLFHLFGNGLTMLMDVIPIGVFTLTYLWFVLRRLGCTQFKAFSALLIFGIVAAQMSSVPEEWRFNGSVAYFPCLAVLIFIGSILHATKRGGGKEMLLAAVCFAISLTFRSLDMTMCAAFPIGVHFLWHSINGLVLYLLTKAIIRVS